MNEKLNHPKNNSSIQNIQALRGIAALLVLVAHIAGAETDYGGGQKLLPFFLNMGVTGVDLFFLISGFIMVYVTREDKLSKTEKPTRQDRLKNAAGFLYRRTARIYPLYWVLTIFMLTLYGAKKIILGEGEILPNLVSSFLLLPNDNLPIIPVGWTLIHEMYFYIVFSLFLVFRRKWLPALLTLWGALVILGAALGLNKTGPWSAVLFSPLTLEFLFGSFIGFISLRKTRLSPIVILSLSGMIVLILLVPLAPHLYPETIINHALRTLIFTLPYGLLLYGAVIIEWKKSTIAHAWLIKIGDASYSLYLVHIPFILVIGTVIKQVGYDGIYDNIILIIVSLIGGIFAALMTYKWIEQPLLKFAKMMNPMARNIARRA